MQKLHEKYGDIVRVAPTQVSFTDPRAWKDTMGHRRAGKLENVRDPVFYNLAKGGIIGPISSEEHGRQRRILSHGFSAQAMMDQQPLIRQYVDLLMQRLKASCEGGSKALDMTKWYNWTTFVCTPSRGSPYVGLSHVKELLPKRLTSMSPLYRPSIRELPRYFIEKRRVLTRVLLGCDWRSRLRGAIRMSERLELSPMGIHDLPQREAICHTDGVSTHLSQCGTLPPAALHWENSAAAQRAPVAHPHQVGQEDGPSA